MRLSARANAFFCIAFLAVQSVIAQGPTPAIAVGKDPCDCSIVPWRPPSCAEYCLTRAIANSNLTEIKAYLKLDKATLTKIDDAKKNPPTEKATLKKILADAQVKLDVTKAVSGADKLSVHYLLAEPKEKLKLIEDKSVAASLPPEVIRSREKGNS
jgi:hypothetical protein